MGMNFRKRGGGGFLHKTDGVIEGYKFDVKEWEGAKGPYHKMSIELSVRPDGAEGAVQQFLDAGFFYTDSAVVSKDKQTISGLDEDGNEVELPQCVIEEDSEAGRFLASLEAAAEGSDVEVTFPENGSELSTINGLRVTFEKVADREKQIELGRARIAKKSGKKAGAAATEDAAFEAGKRADKKDASKSYNVDILTVSAVLGRETAKGKGKGAKAAAAAPKAATKAKAKVEESDDIETQAVTVLQAILKGAKDKTILRSQVSGKIVAYCNDNGIDNDVREQLREVIFGEAFLKSEAGWSYDAKDRKQPISLS